MSGEQTREKERKSPVVGFGEVFVNFDYMLMGIDSELITIEEDVKTLREEIRNAAQEKRDIQREINRITDLRAQGVLQFNRTLLKDLRIKLALVIAREQRLDRELRGLWHKEHKLKKVDTPHYRKKKAHAGLIIWRVEEDTK